MGLGQGVALLMVLAQLCHVREALAAFCTGAGGGEGAVVLRLGHQLGKPGQSPPRGQRATERFLGPGSGPAVGNCIHTTPLLTQGRGILNECSTVCTYRYIMKPHNLTLVKFGSPTSSHLQLKIIKMLSLTGECYLVVLLVNVLCIHTGTRFKHS